MDNAQIASIIALVSLLIVLMADWKTAVSFTAIGVFWMCNVVFVALGSLSIPWVFPYLGQDVLFSSFDFRALTTNDLMKAIVLIVGGLHLVLLSYHIVEHGVGGRTLGARSHLALTAEPAPAGLSSGRLAAVGLLVIGFALWFTARNWDVILEGIMIGFVEGDPEVVLLSRREMHAMYLYVLLVSNVLPFFGVGLWLLARLRGGGLPRTGALAFNVCTAVLLILQFEKRPFIVWLGALLLSEWWVRSRTRPARAAVATPARRSTGLRYWILAGVVLFTLLLGMFYFHTKSAREEEDILAVVYNLSMIVLTRIFGRLSLPAAFYAHYFPNVGRHYGFSTMWVVAWLVGRELYQVNAEVFAYFTGWEGGSIASSAILDFYGAFGVTGWICGCILLGFMLREIDRAIAGLRENAAKILLTIFTFVFVYYLSQASVSRAVLGYGGVIFLGCWFLVRTYSVSDWLPRIKRG